MLLTTVVVLQIPRGVAFSPNHESIPPGGDSLYLDRVAGGPGCLGWVI